MKVYEHLELLGKKVEDRVTGFKGVVASVSFDLYGCIQAVVNPGMGKDGKLGEQTWFDIARLKVMSDKPVMAPPDFIVGVIADGKSGPAEKPQFGKS
jgi:hypothetical protein